MRILPPQTNKNIQWLDFENVCTLCRIGFDDGLAILKTGINSKYIHFTSATEVYITKGAFVEFNKLVGQLKLEKTAKLIHEQKNTKIYNLKRFNNIKNLAQVEELHQILGISGTYASEIIKLQYLGHPEWFGVLGGVSKNIDSEEFWAEYKENNKR